MRKPVLLALGFLVFFAFLSAASYFKSLTNLINGTTPSAPLVVQVSSSTGTLTLPQFDPSKLKVFFCANCFVARNLFPQAKRYKGSKSKATPKDILFYGWSKDCSKSWKTFPGLVILYNGESGIDKGFDKPKYVVKRAADITDAASKYWVKKLLYLGPLGSGSKAWPSETHFQLYGEMLKPCNGKERSCFLVGRKKRKIPKQYLVYRASNCVAFRQDAYDALASIGGGPAVATGYCFGSRKDTHEPDSKRANSWEKVNQKPSTHRFVLAMENQVYDGYITEKIVLAFLSGAIPIYYGTADVFQIFNSRAFIFYDVDDPQPAIDRVKYLESNRTAYLEMARLPILKDGENTLREYFLGRNEEGGKGKLQTRVLDWIIDNRRVEFAGDD
jgi:hypothetical protein